MCSLIVYKMLKLDYTAYTPKHKKKLCFLLNLLIKTGSHTFFFQICLYAKQIYFIRIIQIQFKAVNCKI